MAGERSVEAEESIRNKGKLIKHASTWLGLLSGLFGMGPPKLPEPLHARGTIAMSEQLLDVRELAVQVSDMVADKVMSKLSAIGLTAENIKKLESLGEAPPLDAIGGCSRIASLADAALSKLTAVGLTEENTKKLATLRGGTSTPVAGDGSQAAGTLLHLDDDADNLEIPSSSFTEDPFDSSTWASKNSRQGSLSSLQMSAGRPKPLVERRPLLSETRQSAISSHPPMKLHAFETLPQSPMQFSMQRKRAATPEVTTQKEVMFPRPKKRTRHDDVDCEKDELLIENDLDTHMRESLGEEWSECLRADMEIQVDIRLC